MWIKRDFEPILRKLFAQRPALILTGARQTGKSSLLTHLFPQATVLSLDLPSDAQRAELDPESFLNRHSTPLIIDEVQYAPALFRFLKKRIDGNRGQAGQYLLSGSQKFVLMKEVSDSLAGRAEIVELDPLSLREIHAAHPALALEAVIVRGGFPELYADLEIDPRRFYRSYVSSYLERDVRSLVKVRELRDFERFLRACAIRSSQLLNKSDLARDVGVSPTTANEWLSVLQASNQIALLEPWFSNRTKSIAKTPKLYFCDTGLLLYLLNIGSPDELTGSPFLGAIWENFVYCELRKRLELTSEKDSLFFYRDRNRETDFLIHRGGRFDLFEAKWTETPTMSHLAGIRDAVDFLGEKHISSAAVICRAARPFPVTRLGSLQVAARGAIDVLG